MGLSFCSNQRVLIWIHLIFLLKPSNDTTPINPANKSISFSKSVTFG